MYEHALDLHRILKVGIDNTSMPSFGLLPEVELEQLVSYVIHLSLRGQGEEATMTTLLKKQPLEVEGEIAIIYRLSARWRGPGRGSKDIQAMS